MAVTSLPRQDTAASAPATTTRRGLTLRSFVICVFALLLMGIWIEYEECFVSGGPLAENSPPNSAVLVILILLAISALLYRFRKQLGLVTAELVFIYAALLVAAPLMTQGMWHRFFGLLAAIPHDQDFKSYESLPENLWPHGANLVVNGQFVKGMEGFDTSKAGTLGMETLAWRGKQWQCPVLSNGDNAAGSATLAFTIPRFATAGNELLIPGESYLFSMLVKADAFQTNSSYAVRMRADEGPWRNVMTNTMGTSPSFANPNGFTRIGICPLSIPTDLEEKNGKLTMAVTLTGPGKLTLHDVQFFNSMAVEGVYTGIHVVKEQNAGKLNANERNFTVTRPKNMISWAGLMYLLKGYIPWGQWVRPLLSWSVLVLALFLGFLGFNVLMRKQWVESERFTFPMNILPRHLFAEESEDDEKKTASAAKPAFSLRPIFRNKIMWIGFGITLPLVLLRGLQFYYPAIQTSLPFLGTGDIWGSGAVRLDQFVTSPGMKAYLQNVDISIVFCLLAITLLIETDLLFSIWASFLLFQFFYLFGKTANFNRYVGYPWEWQQAIGSFIAYAFLAVLAGRKHLTNVFKQILGRLRPEDSEEIISYRAALLLIIVSVLLMLLWGTWTKMGPLVALLFFGWLLVCGFAASKIRAECGLAFAYWTPYFGMTFVSAMGGFAVFGTTGMLVATIAAGFMCVSCFLFIAPVQVEMMELGRHFKVRPKDIGHGLVMGLVGGLLIGGFVLLSWAYGKGADNMAYGWPYGQGWYFTNYRVGEGAADRTVAKLVADKQPVTPKALMTPETAPMHVIDFGKKQTPLNVDAKGMSIGFLITCAIAWLRSTFMWFPIHPVGFVLATTFFARKLWFTCFVAWLVRLIVLRIGGAHTVRKGLIPFAVGMFLACMVSIVFFDLVGFYLRHHGVTNIYCAWP